MTLLDRHLFRAVLTTCLAAMGLFGFLFMLENVIRDLLGLVLAGQIGLATFGRLTFLLVPFVISFALPLGLLTGVLLALGRLSADAEITAMRAAGLGIRRIARPILVLAVLGTAAAFKVNFDSMPWARVTYHKELADAVRANPVKMLVPGTFVRDFPGIVVYVGSKDGPDLRDIWLWRLDGHRRASQFLRADSGRVTYDDLSNELVLTLGRTRAEDLNQADPEDFASPAPIGSFERSDPIRLSLDRFFGRPSVRRKLQWMTYGELGAEQARLEAEARSAWAALPPPQSPARPAAREHARDLDRAAMKVAMTTAEKANLALAVFSFALVGIPLGIRVSRKETSANLALAAAMALGYYLLTTMVGWLDPHPEYRPDLLLWVPNLVFLSVGGWLMATIDRR